MTDTAIFVFDDFHPEDNAMVQALYSRSPDSVLSHREKVFAGGSGKFMDQFYVGYGHASIGDCGSTTIFIENVSMLVAKALQDSGLYSGQEASTRYLDFSVQPQYDPYNHDSSKAILQKWLELYSKYMPLAIEGLKRLNPFDPTNDQSEKTWSKAIDVRAFDTLRSLLPVGTTTLLSWHTNLRQARDHLRHLSSHPLVEIRDIANGIFTALKNKYPNSFHGEEMDPDSDHYRARNDYAAINGIDNHYLTSDYIFDRVTEEERHLLVTKHDILVERVICGEKARLDPAIHDRPKGALLPRRFTSYGVYNLTFLLDFGSFRDLQRHRNGYCPVPIIGNDFGFHYAYDDELKLILSDNEYTVLKEEIDTQINAIESLSGHGIETDMFKDQYLYPMGMACTCTVSYSIPEMVYVGELRSGKTVHFSLRPIAQKMGLIVAEDLPELNLYIDHDKDSFTAKRGEQDITLK